MVQYSRMNLNTYRELNNWINQIKSRKTVTKHKLNKCNLSNVVKIPENIIPPIFLNTGY